MKKCFIIYALHHDASDRVYVGMSSRGLARSAEHRKASYRRKWPHLAVSRWANKYPDFQVAVLEECSDIEALRAAECFYIAAFRALGMRLLNLTDGGEGVIGYVKSREVIARAAAKVRGRKMSPEQRARMSAGHSTPEQRALRAAANRRRVWSAESRAKASIASKKRGPHNAERRQKLAAQNRGRVWTPAMKAKLWAKRDLLCPAPSLRVNLLGAV